MIVGMSLASSREQRSSAGSRMSKLLDAEEEDEFYKTTYGGFNDESGDDEYRGDHSDTEDVKTSDFDIDEGDEPDSDQEDDAPRRKSRVVTKAYKVRHHSLSHTHTHTHTLFFLQFVCVHITVCVFSEKYERLEADKKKQVHKKRRFEGPSIRYHSVLMLLVPDAHTKEENVDVEGLDQDTPQATPTSSSSAQGAGSLCSRTYITFSDDQTFSSAFPASARSSPAQPVQKVCPVTHKPALYRDPVTDIPYANARAFRTIREAHQKYIAAHGFPNASGNFSGNRDFSVSPAAAAKSTRPKAIVKHSVVAT
ncbi:vacuolar protein sorting-associated protein 72 homolog [Sinocyclocheilus grahami]|uniref:vacuolar protein sorting-associated protein 72 homolog n=1 Tax=Sinocyclocheilus grahami TaxID=75366 RepID=UPI0007AD2908|nr:PREDICTED: vacuolar protein sorting-associated protein 72 homolog [Sinocyclocheilus grahami]